MIKLTRALILLTGLAIFAACNAALGQRAPIAQGGDPYAPQPGDSNMLRGELRIESAELRVAESYPPQVMLHFAYFPPTPCYELRAQASQPDAQNRINVAAYGVTEKDKACTLMALATPLQADLNLGSFPKGHYSVWLNGGRVGEFDS